MQCACVILSYVAFSALRMFQKYLKNATIFEKHLLNTKYVFWFPLQLLSEIFLILRRTERDTIKNVYWSSWKVPVFIVRFVWNLKFRNSLLKKYSNIKFHENPSSGSRVVPGGQTDGRKDWHDKANSRSSQFCERSKKDGNTYTGWSKSLCAPDDCTVIVRCTETFWSLCIYTFWMQFESAVSQFQG